MLNIYDYISNNGFCKTFKVDELLFCEYRCMVAEERVAYWTHNNYFAFLLSGQTRYTSGNEEHVLNEGEAIFVRKGTYVAQRSGNTEYCALLIFVSDDFISKILSKYPAVVNPYSPTRQQGTGANAIFSLQLDAALSTYFHSVLSYFPREVAPSPALLKIKFEELLLNILTGDSNRMLASCLCGIRDCGKVSLRDIMESSFMYPMSLEEYARLCARSLSAFKSDFYNIYKTSPGKWLLHARLRYARVLIETTGDAVRDIASKSGFKNTAHFVKVFKEAYGMPPHQYRLKVLVS